MKNYTEYLNEQYTPLTRDELTKLWRAHANFDPKYLREYATAHQHENDDMVIKSALSDALGEIEYLRGQMIVAYEYIGRRAPNPAPAKYRKVMTAATTIRAQDVDL
tara:strand:+ start:756 stop:1073 length:318 start_codon:yes stop_codon:yes gene_type:complete